MNAKTPNKSHKYYDAAAIARLCKKPRQTSGGWQACCPAHDDKKPSLSIADGNTATVLRCHAGCKTSEILASLDLGYKDISHQWKPSKTNGTAAPPIYNPKSESPPAKETPPAPRKKYLKQAGMVDVEYHYLSATNELLGTKIRHYQDGQSKGQTWIDANRFIGLGDVKINVPYRLPEWHNKPAVCIVEGEKDADRLWDLGIPATTLHAGATSSWTADIAKCFFDKRVVLIPDYDLAGWRYAEAGIKALKGVAKSTTIIKLPNHKAAGNDVSDWLDSGKTLNDLHRLFNVHLRQSTETLGTNLSRDKFPTWLVEGWIPRRRISLISGDSGTGKSSLAFNFASLITTGRKFGYGNHWFKVEQGHVAIFTSEEIFEEVAVHQLDLMGADGGGYTHVADYDLSGGVTDLVTEHYRLLERADLLIFDPLVDILGDKDINSTTAVRRAMLACQPICEEFNLGILGIHHDRKSGLDLRSASGRVKGAAAWVEKSRLVMQVQEINHKKTLMRTKGNIWDLEGGFTYDLKVDSVGFANDAVAYKYVIPVLDGYVQGAGDKVLYDAMQPKESGAREDAKRNRKHAEIWLRELFTESPTRLFAWSEILQLDKSDGHFAEATLRHARAILLDSGFIATARVAMDSKSDGRSKRYVWFKRDKESGIA